MRLHEIENWALSVIERVEAGRPNEDARVELKTTWPEDIPKAARQLAGQANAARSATILWLIGVNQKAGAVVGTSQEEMSAWYPRIAAQFDGLAPHVQNINVPVRGVEMVALLFETDRAPFVVKNPFYGVAGERERVQLEVPWRENDSTRSATRADLLRLLVPQQRQPECEVMGGRLTNQDTANNPTAQTLDWSLHLELYVYPKDSTRIIIPDHRCNAEFEIVGQYGKTTFEHACLVSLEESFINPNWTLRSAVISRSRSAIVINGPGLIELVATVTTAKVLPLNAEARITAALLPVDAPLPIALEASLPSRSQTLENAWEWVLSSAYNETPGIRSYL